MKRTKVVRVRLTVAEYRELRRKARDMGVTTSAILRDQATTVDKIPALERQLYGIRGEIASLCAAISELSSRPSLWAKTYGYALKGGLAVQTEAQVKDIGIRGQIAPNGCPLK